MAFDTRVSPARAGVHRLFQLGCALGLALVLGACASRPLAATVAELAPTGKLRAAINFGNPILASKDGASGGPRGVSVDLSRELAKRLGVPLELVNFNSAGRVVDVVRAAQVDVAYVAIDPVRGADMNYTAAYVVIEGAYLVRNDSPIRVNAEVDRPGVRVAVGAGSAYDLYLKRELKAATLQRAPTSPAVTDFFMANKLEVAIPKGRDAGIRYLRDFIEEMKASGFVAQALARHGIEGAAVAALQP